jgi:predicted dehydrogenase
MEPHFGGFRHEMEHPLLVEMAVHTFDQMRFITGEEPLSVYCLEFNPSGSLFRGAAAAECVFECTSGCVFSYRGSWAAEGCRTSWASEWRVVGDRGTAVWDGEGAPHGEMEVEPIVVEPVASEPLWPTRRLEFPHTYAGEEGHAGCIESFFAGLASGTRPETDSSDNIKSLAMVFAALESSRRGERVVITEYWDEIRVSLEETDSALNGRGSEHDSEADGSAQAS